MAHPIERRWTGREVERRDGTRVPLAVCVPSRRREAPRRLRKAWSKACAEAGVPALLFHDLRRSAARNLVRAGVDSEVARKITGHKTESMFRRYNVIDERYQREALRRVDLDVAARTGKRA